MCRGHIHTQGGDVVSNQPQHQSTKSWLSSTAPRKLLDEISEPGAYVCHGSGDLLRVADTEAPPDNVEPIQSHGSQPVYVTQISRDPFVPITKARVAAANLDIEIHF